MAWTTLAMGAQLSVEERIITFYPDIVREVQNHGLSGPIAHEAAQYAQLRCIHEDGLDRPPDVSLNGMVPGSPNKEVVKRLYMPDHKLSHASSHDGQGCYMIKGPKAHVMGSVAIALWYDMMINSDRYRVCSKEDRRIWNLSRHYSHMIAIGNNPEEHEAKFQELRDHRLKIIQKVNQAYGPQGHHINQLRQKKKDLFESVFK